MKLLSVTAVTRVAAGTLTFLRRADVPAAMLELDGTEAGGQFLRSALTLSILRNRAVTVENVRGARPTPGLKPQHLAAVEAAAAVCDGTVTGATEGSETVRFEPGPLRGGEVTVEVGTAGSIGLIFDALLPLGLALAEPLRVRATGGTDVKWAPPLSTYARVKLPLVRRLGMPAAVDIDRRGFYPVGGGAATLTVGPASPSPLDLTERGDREGVRIHSLATTDLADDEVAERQAGAVSEALEDWSVAERTVCYVEADSPGSVCTVRADFAESVAGFDALGERGTPAEVVGAEAAAALASFADTDAAVDRHLADQLLIPLAVAGGKLSIPAVTDHVAASVELLATFGYDLTVSERGSDVLVTAPA